MWNAQLIEYPIISRDKAGEWNYFDVTPDKPEMVYEGGKVRPPDGVTPCATRGGGRARSWRSRPSAIASRYYEVDSCVLNLVLAAAHEALKDPDRSGNCGVLYR
jgi:hypothetical protein